MNSLPALASPSFVQDESSSVCGTRRRWWTPQNHSEWDTTCHMDIYEEHSRVVIFWSVCFRIMTDYERSRYDRLSRREMKMKIIEVYKSVSLFFADDFIWCTQCTWCCDIEFHAVLSKHFLFPLFLIILLTPSRQFVDIYIIICSLPTNHCKYFFTLVVGSERRIVWILSQCLVSMSGLNRVKKDVDDRVTHSLQFMLCS